ncbi:MAG: sensor histidine kinase [Thermoplasmatota archaeon]
MNGELATRLLELSRSNEELETFSHTVSHDLRTPLAIIENYVHVLTKRGQVTSPESRQALEGIHAAVLRMSTMIGNILQLSRAMRQPLQPESVDLSGMATRVLAELAERDPARRVEVTVEPDLRAVADPALVSIILANLLGNAWKFSARKKKARIAFGAQTQTGAAAFYVRDNGAGFDMDDAGRLFEMFTRLHTSAQFTGTGIGLATVSHAVRRLGGTVWASAKPGRGATLFFTLGTGMGAGGGP